MKIDEVTNEQIINLAQRRSDETARHLAAALKELRAASTAVSLWADEIRWLGERRTGLSCVDLAMLDDPAYAAALEKVGAIRDAMEAVVLLGDVEAAQRSGDRCR
jgi:hypothetical protein